MSERPSDSMMPSSKRRPGEQLTKDDADDDDDGGEVRRGPDACLPMGPARRRPHVRIPPVKTQHSNPVNVA